MTLKYLGAILFFLMMATPFELYAVKIFIMVLLVVYRIYLILIRRRLDLSKSVFLWFMILISFGLFFSFWSLLSPYSNIGFVFKILPVYFVWPLFYMLLVPFLLDVSVLNLLNRTMVYASIFISGYLILAFLSLIGLLPISFQSFTLVKPILGRSESVEAQLFMPAVTSLLFLNPFLLSSLLLGFHKKYEIPQTLVFLAFIGTTIAIIVTGRRSLMLNIILALPVLYFFLKFSRIKLVKTEKKLIKKITLFLVTVGVILFGYMSYYGLVDLGAFWNFFVSGFDFSSGGSDIGSELRGEQFGGLIQSWKDFPFLGSGLASQSEYVLRNADAPWMYELSYFAWLFQTGIIGFITIISLLIWLFLKSILIIRKDNQFVYIIPALVGCFAFLVGCISNPYLQAFDHMWAIFLPAGLINYCIKKRI
jgi:hypothetical protein